MWAGGWANLAQRSSICRAPTRHIVRFAHDVPPSPPKTGGIRTSRRARVQISKQPDARLESVIASASEAIHWPQQQQVWIASSRSLLAMTRGQFTHSCSFRGIQASEAHSSFSLPLLWGGWHIVSIANDVSGGGCFTETDVKFTHRPHLRDLAAHSRASFARIEPSEIQRAQGMPGARRAAASRAKMKKHTSVVTTVTPIRPAFPAQWFYDLYRDLPGDRALLSPSPAELLPPT